MSGRRMAKSGMASVANGTAVDKYYQNKSEKKKEAIREQYINHKQTTTEQAVYGGLSAMAAVAGFTPKGHFTHKADVRAQQKYGNKAAQHSVKTSERRKQNGQQQSYMSIEQYREQERKRQEELLIERRRREDEDKERRRDKKPNN